MKTTTTRQAFKKRTSRARRTIHRRFFPPLGTSAVGLWLAPALGTLALGLVLTLAACGSGGGGGGSGGNPPAPSSDIVISGLVLAPGGALAYGPKEGWWEKFTQVLFPAALAVPSGMATVPDGTPVDLIALDNAGAVAMVRASTTTSAGRYSFNLSTLGIAFSSDLAVRAIGTSSGSTMRAFVGMGPTVDIDPVSEAAVRLVVEKIAGAPGLALNNFTPQELTELAAAVNLRALAQGLAGGMDVESTVTAFKAAVLADNNVVAFLAAIAPEGQSSEGPGDIGNFFPFAQGNTWVYRITEQTNAQAPSNYTNTEQITGTKVIDGVMTTVFQETNPNNSGILSEDYRVKDSRAITNYGDTGSASFLTSQLVPYREYMFPLTVDAAFQPFNRSGLSWGQDIDGDGKFETANITATVKVAGFESVTVSAGTFINAAKIVINGTIKIILSSDGTSATVALNVTEWHAPGVGLVKSTSVDQVTVFNVTDTITITEELLNYSVF